MLKINCIVIEDNTVDRVITEDFVSQIPYLHLTGSFSNPMDAIGIIKNSVNDQLLLLDIDMPVANGIDFFKSLKTNSLCIFITSHPEYALEGFEAHALDYIVKPLKFERFEHAIARAREYLDYKGKAVLYDLEFEKNLLTIKEGTTTIQIKMNDIIYLEALGDYTKIITTDKKYLTLNSLKNFIEKLPADKFLRIHRSYAVARDKIISLEQNELVLEKIKLPIGKTFRRDISKSLMQQTKKT